MPGPSFDPPKPKPDATTRYAQTQLIADMVGKLESHREEEIYFILKGVCMVFDIDGSSLG